MNSKRRPTKKEVQIPEIEEKNLQKRKKNPGPKSEVEAKLQKKEEKNLQKRKKSKAKFQSRTERNYKKKEEKNLQKEKRNSQSPSRS